jgi:hypothetical protein
MPLPALITELIDLSHWWTVDHEVVMDYGGPWVTSFATGRGCARCSCGLRIGEPADPVPLTTIEESLAHHVAEARAAAARTTTTHAKQAHDLGP